MWIFPYLWFCPTGFSKDRFLTRPYVASKLHDWWSRSNHISDQPIYLKPKFLCYVLLSNLVFVLFSKGSCVFTPFVILKSLYMYKSFLYMCFELIYLRMQSLILKTCVLSTTCNRVVECSCWCVISNSLRGSISVCHIRSIHLGVSRDQPLLCHYPIHWHKEFESLILFF